MKSPLKFTLLFSLLFLILNTGYSINSIHQEVQDKSGLELMQDQLSFDDILQKDRREIEEQIGSKLTFKEKLALKIVQKKAKKAVKKGKTQRDTKEAFAAANLDVNVGGFLLGLILGLLGVLLAYLFMDKGAAKSAWYGLAVWIIVLILVL